MSVHSANVRAAMQLDWRLLDRRLCEQVHLQLAACIQSSIAVLANDAASQVLGWVYYTNQAIDASIDAAEHARMQPSTPFHVLAHLVLVYTCPFVDVKVGVRQLVFNPVQAMPRPVNACRGRGRLGGAEGPGQAHKRLC
jgi:hypothetical protein